jgi:uncharacterized repeat protein (TIGR01451 family)
MRDLSVTNKTYAVSLRLLVAITMAIIFILAIMASLAWAATPIYVRPDGSDTLCDGTVDAGVSAQPNCAVQTIQQAVTLVDPAGLIRVTAGIYTGPVTINKSLTLVGYGAGTAVIQSASDGVIVSVSDVTISNTTISGSGSNTGISATGTINNLTVRDSTISDFEAGIYVDGGSGHVVQNNVITNAVATLNSIGIDLKNNSDVTVSTVEIQNFEKGIQYLRDVAGGDSITITNNFIHYDITSVLEPGLYLQGTGIGTGTLQATIQDNRVLGYETLIQAAGLAPSLISGNVLTTTGNSFVGGIVLNQAGPSLVENNTLAVSNPASSTVKGIYLSDTANPTITRNNIDSEFSFAMDLDDFSSPVISDSIISGHGDGIIAAGDSTPTIIRSLISNNTARGIRIIGDAVISATGNTICRNIGPGVLSSSSITDSQNLVGNWWGSNPPLNTAAPLDYDPDTLDVLPPISMSLEILPSSLLVLNSTSPVTLTMRGGGQSVLDGTSIAFSADDGGFAPINTTTLDGLAGTVYSATVLGTHTITATDGCGGIVTTTVTVGQPVLSATKTAIPLPGSNVQPGERITYTVWVTNSGNFTVSNVVFSDTVPTFTQLAFATVDSGTITTTNPVSATFEPIGPNGVVSVTLGVTVTLPLTNGTLITNSASISYFNGAESVLTTTNVVTHVVESAPLLTMTKEAVPASGSEVIPGEVITYTVTVENLGDANAEGLVISDTLPVYGTVVYTAATGNVTLLGGNPYQATIDFLAAPAGTAVLTVALQVSRPLTNGIVLTNTAQVTTTTIPTVTYSNEVTHTVISSATVEIEKESDPAAGTEVEPGEAITYTLTVTNSGTEIAQGVVVTDAVPVYTTLDSAVSGSGTVVDDGSVITWTIGTLTVDSPVTATFVVTVARPLTNGLIISNEGVVTYAGAAVVTGSNVVTHLVRSAPALSFEKVSEPPHGSTIWLSSDPPTQITYTIVVTNDGSANATGVVVTDTLPADTSGVTSPLVWSPGFIAGDGGVVSTTFVVTVNVPLADYTVLTNSYSVIFDQGGVYTEASVISPTNVVTHLIRSEPVLTYEKRAEPVSGSTVSPGDTISYTVVVTNEGTANATNLEILDYVPDDTGYVASSVAISGGVNSSASYSGIQNSVSGTADVLTVGQRIELSYQVRVTTPLTDGTIIQNSALVGSSELLPAETTNVVTHVVESAPLLTVTKEAVPASGSEVIPGEVITYTVTVENLGDANAEGLVISDTLPVYGTVVYTAATGNVTLLGGNPYQATIDFLAAPAGTAVLTVALQVSRPLTNGIVLTNTAQVTTTTIPTVTYSNEVTHTVISSATVEIEKESDPAAGTEVEPGEAITYTLTVTNSGTEIAQGVVVTDAVPVYTTLDSAVSGSGTVVDDGSVITWTIGTLTVDSPVTATFVVTVARPLTNGLIISNEGVVTYAGAAVVTGSNVVTHLVRSAPALSFEKVSEPPHGSTIWLSSDPPTQITYTIVVTNDGSANATGVVVTDTLPADTSGVTSPLVWSPGFIAGDGGVVSTTFVVTVNVPLADYTVLTNSYSVIFDQGGVYTEASVISPTNVVTHLIRSEPVLTYEKRAEPVSGSTVSPGDTISYTVVVTNEGTANATNLEILDYVPDDTGYVASSVAISGGVNSSASYSGHSELR